MKKILSLLFFLSLGALLTEGFQCASPELTTAKLAIRNKEWKKAEVNLESAVSKNAKEKEAWILLAQVKDELGKYEEEANIIKQASKNIEDKETKSRLNEMERKLWVASYQRCIDEYNKFISSISDVTYDNVSYENFLKIKDGDNFKQVVDLLGNQYELNSQSSEFEIYTWKNGDKIITVSFTGKKVSSKTQIGLDHEQPNKEKSKKDMKYFNSALYNLNVAISIRPEKAELTRIKGQLFESVYDTIQTVTCYNNYITLIDKELNFAKEKHIYLNMSRDELLKTIGKPNETKSIKFSPMSDSIINDFFNINGTELIVTSIEKNKGMFNIDGWTVNPPSNWPQNDKTDLNIISIGPIAELAQIAFQKKEYKKSIEYVLNILTIDPNNVDANSFLINVYEAQGGVEEALKSSAELVKANPNNKFYRLQYGQMLFKVEKYQEAIDQFEKAIQIDQIFAAAVRNLAAAYKNKAVLMQREQQDAADKDPKYKKKPELYIPFLDKSAAFFLKAKQFKEYSKDFYVLSELANIFNVTDKKADCTRILEELEKLEPEIPLEQKYDYYLKLVKIYGDLKMSDKMNRAREEAEKYAPNE
ncbi:MAG: hypothetical protein A2X61_14930 [Ignavibacteria bacterium GWB2_35_12]|nr:MAG: hypothetical protein A2X61_14930 [Ignavibacteria bacterium GWB2_35_12]OGU94177.1 MAG: hypothetical protein A2220_01585 [Ignavibacteria bacterium RIFOXYA2_FULL_35_10]OGV23389.1 MAG: hypothetical protein A2475_06325 [Ignavibacteria bacterium RIFOXYC2_FULL_35_21]